MTIKPFLVDGNIVVNEATITNSGTSIVLPTNSHFSGGGNIFNISTNTTDDITQGTTNLYFTNTRFDARISAASITALSDADQTVQTTDNVTFNNITSTGYLAGPASFTIDPAAVGDNTGTVVIAGNLTVNGTTTTVNSNTVNIGDNILVLNSDETGTPSQDAGIEIERGTSTNVSLRWNETTDKWQFTNDGTTYNDLGTSDIVNDTTPQLGGNLDVNGKSITASSGTIDFEINNHKSFFIGDSYIKIDADNNYSAGLSFIRDKSTPANGDVLAYIFAKGRDSGNQLQSFARIDLNSEIVTAGAERGAIVLRNVVGSTYQDFFKADANLMQNILYKDIKADTGVDLIFEGATANTYETTLTVTDPTADRTITLPDATGTVPVFATAPTSAITDGTAGQVLQTNGSGALSFVDQSEGAVGGGTDKTFLETDNSVNSNYTLSTNRNAMTTGPVTINSGATVTVPSGQRWVIL